MKSKHRRAHKKPGRGRLISFFVRVLSACGNVIDEIPVYGHRQAYEALIALRREGARVRLFAHDDRGRLYRSRVC